MGDDLACSLNETTVDELSSIYNLVRPFDVACLLYWDIMSWDGLSCPFYSCIGGFDLSGGEILYICGKIGIRLISLYSRFLSLLRSVLIDNIFRFYSPLLPSMGKGDTLSMF